MDANARTGRRGKGQVGSNDNKIIVAYGRDTLNDNGELLLSFANNYDLSLVNTFFSTSKGGVSHTFIGRGKKRIDDILTRQRDPPVDRRRLVTDPQLRHEVATAVGRHFRANPPDDSSVDDVEAAFAAAIMRTAELVIPPQERRRPGRG